jgi:hypothetical protein
MADPTGLAVLIVYDDGYADTIRGLGWTDVLVIDNTPQARRWLATQLRHRLWGEDYVPDAVQTVRMALDDLLGPPQEPEP